MASETPAPDLAAVIDRLQAGFVRRAPSNELFDALLPELLAMTRSAYGFIGEVWRDPAGAPFLKIFSIIDIAWDEASRRMLEPHPAQGIEFRSLTNLMGRSLVSGTPLIANDAMHDPRRGGLPAGHPGLESYLGVPLFHGGELVGEIGLANRDGGYDLALVEALEPLFSAMAAIIGSAMPARARDRAEAVLRARDAMLQRLTENLPAVLYQLRIGPDGRESIPYASDGLRSVYGLEPEAVRRDARLMSRMIHRDDLARFSETVLASARALTPWRLEFRARLADGSLRWHEGHSTPEREPDGGTLWHGYIVDITERKRYDEALLQAAASERANRAKSEFLSRMSHELRTPLNAVLGFAQLLRMDSAQPLLPAQRERVRHVERAGEHLLAMINDVLDLSRIESGTMSLSPEPMALRPVVDEALAMLAGQAQVAGVALANALDGDPVLLADRVRLRQVLVNLLSNAVKYNRPGGQAQVRAREHADMLAIDVVDDGLGLRPEQVARLWEPFNRLGAERSGIEGTGIGLALSRRLVELMDGRVEVHSVAGQGSRFSVWLPLSDASADGGDTRPSALAPLLHADEHELLYVEDNPLNVLLMAQMLQLRPRLRLRVARSGAEALEQLAAQPCDLLLLDMHLGDMNGLELHALLRARGPLPPLVAVSADALPDRVAEALAAGFDDYLTKPLDASTLLRCVDRFLPLR